MEEVKRFGVFEWSLDVGATVNNPYTDVQANAVFIRPDGGEWSIPLFWDGENVWRVRISPDVVGKWSFRIDSSAPGLNEANGSFECVESSLHGGIMPMEGFSSGRRTRSSRAAR